MGKTNHGLFIEASNLLSEALEELRPQMERRIQQAIDEVSTRPKPTAKAIPLPLLQARL